MRNANHIACLYRATINAAPRTKKNSQQILVRKDGKPFIMPSREYKDYERYACWDLENIPDVPINTPCCVRCHYYMPTRRNADLTNLLEATDDLLVHAGILEDDNSRILVSHDGSRVLYDKERPRTEIWILQIADDEEPEDVMYKSIRDMKKTGKKRTTK